MTLDAEKNRYRKRDGAKRYMHNISNFLEDKGNTGTVFNKPAANVVVRQLKKNDKRHMNTKERQKSTQTFTIFPKIHYRPYRVPLTLSS